MKLRCQYCATEEVYANFWYNSLLMSITERVFFLITIDLADKVLEPNEPIDMFNKMRWARTFAFVEKFKDVPFGDPGNTRAGILFSNDALIKRDLYFQTFGNPASFSDKQKYQVIQVSLEQDVDTTEIFLPNGLGAEYSPHSYYLFDLTNNTPLKDHQMTPKILNRLPGLKLSRSKKP